MTRIVLVRHGDVEGISPPRFRGRADLALTERGECQAQAVARRIAGAWTPGAIYTSPARRCTATAAPIAQACGQQLRVLDQLDDIDYGAWQFRSYAEMQAEQPALFAAWFAVPHLIRFPGGESLQDLVARTANALRLIIERHANETVVAVAHDSANRALLLQLLDQPLSSYWRLAQHPCCINEIEIGDGRVRVERINETAHLDRETNLGRAPAA
jgi:probable phosphoglycerate mutase